MCEKLHARPASQPRKGGAGCDLPGAPEENPMSSASGPRAGNATGVGLHARRIRCSECRKVFAHPGVTRTPHRCPACHKQKQEFQANRTRRRKSGEAALSCVDCGHLIARKGIRGPTPTRCAACKEKAKRTRITYVSDCRHCGKAFDNKRPDQPYCSPECAHTASRSRVELACETCGKNVELTPKIAANRRFCSPACFSASRKIWRVCAGCGKSFNRTIRGTMPHQDKGKYCTKQCYFDHRFGSDRPRKQWSTTTKDRASRRALHTSLRKRCKHYGVPFDPACTRIAVCERDGWRCQDCGIKCHKGGHRFNKKTRQMSMRNAEHDHIVPLAWGVANRGNTFDNSQCLCRKCNLKKGSHRAGQPLFPEFATP